MMITKDMLGQPVEIDSRLAVAFREGNQGVMRIGRVVGVSSRNEYWDGSNGWEQTPRPTLLVTWEQTSGYGGDAGKTTYIYQDVKRYVVIGETA
jgi:hypothetical protein